jgi:hypothetical protein
MSSLLCSIYHTKPTKFDGKSYKQYITSYEQHPLHPNTFIKPHTWTPKFSMNQDYSYTTLFATICLTVPCSHVFSGPLSLFPGLLSDPPTSFLPQLRSWLGVVCIELTRHHSIPLCLQVTWSCLPYLLPLLKQCYKSFESQKLQGVSITY